MARVVCAVLVGLASCAVRPPAPLSVDALLAARGPVEARRELQIRVTSDPRDVAGRLALAELDERIGRPSEAIEAIEAVIALGGPLGVRWHAGDQARMARLIAVRGRARLARGASSALADLERARGLGAAVTDDELRAARIAGAIEALHHSDAEVRDRGRRALALAIADRPAVAEPWVGARSGASPEQRGRFGAWLWQHDARRAAWDELAAWHGSTRPPRDPESQRAYLLAARWWTPLDRPAPPPGDLVGPARCAFAVCAARDAVGDEDAERAYLLAPLAPPVRDPGGAAALAAITLHQALRGEASWGEALAARVDLAAFAEPQQLAKLPRAAQPIFAELAGREAAIPDDGAAATPDDRLLLAAAHALAGSGDAAARVERLVAGSPYADRLRRIAAHSAPFTGDAVAEAVARHAERTAPRAESLRSIVVAYRRDPLIADRLGRDAVAEAADAAAMHATLGALFDALGDPARARAAWQAAVDASAEPAFVRGLAEAQARQGDADAALITATTAAAASGDPAPVWSTIARALVAAGKYVHALEAARSAIDLAGPEALPGALDIAIAASRALGRSAQAEQLARRRAQLAPGGNEPDDRDARDAPAPSPGDEPARALSANGDPQRTPAVAAGGDPTSARAALALYRADKSRAAIARLWVASRWNPRHVAIRAALLAGLGPEDARRGAVVGELVELAGDRDPDVRRAAIAAVAAVRRDR